MCHIVNGVRVQLGPAWDGVANRRSKEWIEVQIRSPKRHSAETMMPAYNLSPRKMGVLIEYLGAMPAQRWHHFSLCRGPNPAIKYRPRSVSKKRGSLWNKTYPVNS